MTAKRKTQSPYQKYGKRPFAYQHPHCSHRNSHVEYYAATFPDQRREQFTVKACDVCNIVVGGPWRGTQKEAQP